MPRLVQRRRTNDVRVVGAGGEDEAVTFESLLLPPALARALSLCGFDVPSPVQLLAIPPARFGADTIVQSKSGTGKTLVFTILCALNTTPSHNSTQSLVLAPTREIALQSHHTIASVSAHLPVELGVGVFVGGVGVDDDRRRVKAGVRVVVGTPGRLRQLIEGEVLRMRHVRLFVLDEADKLLAPGFADDLRAITTALPPRTQMLAVSATFTDEELRVLRELMNSPYHVMLCPDTVALEGVRQMYAIADNTPEARTNALLALLSRVEFVQCVVFTNNRELGKSLVAELQRKHFAANFISGDCAQSHRNAVMRQLREFEIRVLVSTDLTARGVDIENVNCVVNLDLPRATDTYLHRIGRGGRFGGLSVAVTFVSREQEAEILRMVEGLSSSIERLEDDGSVVGVEGLPQAEPSPHANKE